MDDLKLIPITTDLKTRFCWQLERRNW